MAPTAFKEHNMRKLNYFLLSLLLMLWAQTSSAAVNVVACEPEWGALTRELGGDLVNVFDATNALQDPHHIEARPSLIARSRNANLMVCTGSQLEIGWLPLLLRQSGNSAIQPGSAGYFEASAFVPKLEIPTRIDRSEGDIHPGGNPHIQLDPHNIARVANALAKRLAEIDPAHADQYNQRFADFNKRWQAAMQRWEAQAAPLKGVPIIVHHRALSYLNAWLGMQQVAELEPKPGVEPTSSHLASILQLLKERPARMVVRSAYNEDRPSLWIADHAKIPVVVLPFTVGGDDQAKDLFGLFDDTINRLLAALK
jgi:zinc/manganese transport system substrate-binding protein